MAKNYITVLTTGQSNEGRGIGGDTPVLTGVRAWNSLAYPTSAGTKFVDAEIGQKPCKPDQENGQYWNNQFVQFCRELHQRTGKLIYWINVCHGGLAIENWLPNAPILDMFSLIEQEVAAAFSAAGLPNDEKIDVISFAQGEANDSNTTSYLALFEQVIARFKTKSWFGKDTKILHQLIAEHSNSGIVNIDLRKLAAKQNTNFALTDTSGLTLKDTLHWDGVSLTEIAKRSVATYLALNGEGGKVWQPTPLVRSFTPSFSSLEQPITYSNQVGRLIIDNHFINLEWDFSYSCPNINLDNSAIQINIPIGNLNAEFLFSQIIPYLCTGLNINANDAIYFQNQGSTGNLKLRMTDAKGQGVAYSSGKILSSGRFAGIAKYRYS